MRVATAGEALIDLIVQRDGRYEPCLGGAVFNLTRALARQGIGTLYLNPLSSDRFGRQLAAALVSDGVQLARAQPVAQSTSLAVVGLDDTGHPDYAFYRQGVADRAVTAQSLIQSCQREPALAMVCTGALALAPEDAAHYLPWLRAQREAGAVVVVDANLRPSVMPDLDAYRRNVHAALQSADVVKVSDEDLTILGTPGGHALAQAQHLLKATTARLLVLTLGGQGACLLTRDGQSWRARESQPLEVVDTVGAGDCFLAGFMAALLTREESASGAGDVLAPLDDAAGRRLLAHAVASASLCVMRRGCVPPTRAEVQARVEQVPCVFG
ncbi:PfkB family carbohydrate kinase [Polaromonas sp.]|uniref:PfkB family carbohydrate kinase n=1 Tax=Polaromonas sp. TaxID=1869339 RepID=UPI002FCA5B8E